MPTIWMKYGFVQRAENAGGVGIGGGIGGAPEGGAGHTTFYVEVPDVEAALAKAETLGGSRVLGPAKVMDDVELGQFRDPESNLIGLLKAQS